MKLSILIPTIWKRNKEFRLLWDFIKSQSDEIELLSDCDNGELSIGLKRNELLQRSNGEYVAFIDDDDEVSSDYIKLLMEGINKGVDCCSLSGMYFVDGKLDGFFEHSLKYKEWKTNPDNVEHEIKYERYPNHLNCIKASIAKQFKFPEKNFGEDHDWSKQIHESGLLKTEHYIEQPIYYYKYISKK